MANEIFLIGLGHRARNGKDSVADFIANTYPNVSIYHFADPLKEEVMNKKRKIPLIYRYKNKYSKHFWYNVWSHDEEYRSIAEEDLPFLHEIFTERQIEEYWGMDGNGHDEHKDGPMLQFWGTEWRRERFSQRYWVKKTEDYFMENFYWNHQDENSFFLLPDTRFKNEVKWLKDMDMLYDRIRGIYIEVIRYNDDGTRYYAPDRDPNHPSETGLKGYAPDFKIEAVSGDMDMLKKKTDKLLMNLTLHSPIQ
jgi:hypothetical protein